MTAEKGEHERAPRACESYPTSLRATLRAPPSKWAIKAFFRRVSAASRGRGQPRRGYRRPEPTARSDVGRLRSRRAACFLWYFLSLRKKVRPPSGRKPHCSRRSRRVNPPESVSFRQSWRTLMLTVGFPLAPCSPLDRLPVQINNPMELDSYHTGAERARARLFPPSKWAGLFPSAAYRRSAPPQLALGRLNQCELGCYGVGWMASLYP